MHKSIISGPFAGSGGPFVVVFQGAMGINFEVTIKGAQYLLIIHEVLVAIFFLQGCKMRP